MKINRPKPGRTTANFFRPLRFVLPILLLAGCSTVEKIKTAPPVSVVRPLTPPPAAALAMPVEISVETLRRQLEAEARKQTIAAGETPLVSGILSVPCELKKIRVRNTVYDTVMQTKRVHKIVRWTFIIPHWGWVDAPVPVKVPRMVFSVVDEGQNFSGEVLNRFTETVTNTGPASFVIHHAATLEKIDDLAIIGGELSATFLFDWNLSAEVKSGLPAGAQTAGLTAKGLTAVKIKGALGIENARLKISLAENALEVRALAISDVNVDLVPLIPLDETTQLTEKTLATVGEQFLLEKNGRKIRDALQKIGRPAAIGTNLFLDVATSTQEIGPPSGEERSGGKFLVVPVVLLTPVRVEFTANKLPTYQAYIPIDLPVRISQQARALESFQIIGEVALDGVKARMDSALAEIWAQNNFSRKGCEPGATRFWETDGQRFVIGVPLHRKKTGEDLGTLYALGTPRLVAENANPADPKMVELRLDDLDWNAETKDALAKSFSWLAGDQILSALQDASRIPLGGLETQIRERSARPINAGNFSLALNLQSHRVADFTIAGNVLRVTLAALGQPTVTVK